MHFPEIKRTQKTSIRLIMNQSKGCCRNPRHCSSKQMASKVKFRKLKTRCDNLFKTLPLLLTSNSICSQFAHSSSKVVCSVMSAILSAILDFWQPFMNRGLNSFHLPSTFRRFCDGFRTNQKCSCLGGLPCNVQQLDWEGLRVYLLVDFALLS